mmetsp:Transcript_21247/g.50492  ORF Transcript_21247/g.50492 Transcript_21247/m.50492 type:complete len:574 (-) Transcript_21247:300-2021(-)
MREQAAVASAVVADTKEPPTAVASSLYAPGPPATDAFARAIAAAPPGGGMMTTTNNKKKKKTTPPDLPSLGRRPPNTIDDDGEKPPDPVDTPPSSNTSGAAEGGGEKQPPLRSAALARLEEAYSTSERDKTEALGRIRELEEKLSAKAAEDADRARAARKGSEVDVRHLLHLAESKGPAAALDWARSKASSSTTNKAAASFGFVVGMGSSAVGAPSPRRRAARIGSRALRAHPTASAVAAGGDAGQHQQQPVEMTVAAAEATERRLIQKFREAAGHVSHKFSSGLATYTVRKPYGLAGPEGGLFDHLRPPDENPDVYARRAHVSDTATVEVAVVTKADSKPILVFGTAGIRYPGEGAGDEWNHVTDVDVLDRPLGHVTYIDDRANEREYSLDEILEEALLVREQYCGTLTSTALALPDAAAPPQQQQTGGKPPMPPASSSEEQPRRSEQKPESKPPQQQQKAPPPSGDDDGVDDPSSSSDVLVVFLGMVVSFAFNLIWGTFVGMPLRLVRTTIVLVAACFLLQVLHLYLADGYNEWALREMIRNAAGGGGGGGNPAVVASDLAFFSNRHPGLL